PRLTTPIYIPYFSFLHLPSPHPSLLSFPTRRSSDLAPFYRWFPGGVVNSCYNALDRHVEQGRADQPALIYDSPVTGTIKTFTYRELRRSEERRVGKECGTGRAR